ncbi:MAG: RdgB/HAM1 family non-canonical purine NTP pyrophosphatase [Bacteroidia bacterium]
MNLIFASNNAHKLDEVKAILAPSGIEIKSLNDIVFFEDIEETGLTFYENAAIKVTAIHSLKNVDCFADDSGLEVEALDNQPGVFSARYSGEHGNHEANNQKLLKELEGESNRKACFKTVIALMLDGKIHYFEGRVDGVIAEGLSGSIGFGYDPLFIPNGYDRTFADMPAEIKNSISHRKRALEVMLEFLK